MKNKSRLQFSFHVLVKSIAANIFTVITLKYSSVSFKDFYIYKYLVQKFLITVPVVCSVT